MSLEQRVNHKVAGTVIGGLVGLGTSVAIGVANPIVAGTLTLIGAGVGDALSGDKYNPQKNYYQ